jgi:hypothetical protein
MPAVELSLSMPETTWIHDITTAYPTVDFRVLTILVSNGTGHGVVEVESTHPSEILVSLQDKADLAQVDLISVGNTRAVFQIETEETGILEPLTAAGVPLETPIHITDGTAQWEFTTSQDRLSSLSTHLEQSGLEYQVEYVGYDGPSTAATEPNLTDRQAEVFAAAYALGYFEIPRRASVEDVAAETGVTKSTASDTLRRAVRNLVEWYGPEKPPELSQ